MAMLMQIDLRILMPNSKNPLEKSLETKDDQPPTHWKRANTKEMKMLARKTQEVA